MLISTWILPFHIYFWYSSSLTWNLLQILIYSYSISKYMDQYNAWNSLPRTLTIVLMCARDRDRESEPFKEIKIFYLNLESFNFFMTSFRYFLEIFQSLIVNECSVINRMFNSLMKCSIITDIRLFEWNSLPRTLS